MNDAYKHILEQIDVLMNALGKAEVARRLYISRATLYNWIKHPEKMTIQNVMNLNKLYSSWETFERMSK